MDGMNIIQFHLHSPCIMHIQNDMRVLFTIANDGFHHTGIGHGAFRLPAEIKLHLAYFVKIILKHDIHLNMHPVYALALISMMNACNDHSIAGWVKPSALRASAVG